MQFTPEEVERIAALAKLSFSAEERDRVIAGFNQMIAYVSKLDELDLSGVEPATHPLDSGAPLRADETVPSLPREAALRNAPASHDGFFSVPKVIGGQNEEA
ncbi:MAG TPA: Asp-tRNA(Asn)/Glu-tRNA(Gln) amidotransferase subunit GatC [bacterium]|nr:Asp-tRNA(Asn)/Glu-tRNA(Gln) amidotransferase subunit GatC [bacterium]HQG45504.1 Asp-tRNA(Asn)/Glu-tRNA(Gln) amidotransferase subunit GatC [bacterium]HQI47225.1 Asp-tRNA(Asn)/Glu-tRNA(Gln) amidotransferase subunit GatC [bacterium]HQJ65149.1 Asp-tRNA(Asn)/Glu-tRNA(Gln) amidotransferase subunit GatC [bacterium]